MTLTYFMVIKLTPGVHLSLPWGYIHVYDHHSQTYPRSQVSIYRTIGPLVLISDFLFQNFVPLGLNIYLHRGKFKDTFPSRRSPVITASLHQISEIPEPELSLSRYTITKNLSMQYTETFFSCKNQKFLLEFFLYFSYFCSKHRLWVHNRTALLRGF